MSHRLRLMLCVFTAVTALSSPAHSQNKDYPNRPIRLIVDSATGGITDIISRLLQQQLATGLGRQLIIDNKPGAGGAIGGNYVAKSTPDGYTLVSVNVGGITILPWINKKLAYNPAQDLVGVAPIGEVPSVFAVNDEVPAKTMKEFIAYAKQNPEKINYGSAGIGTFPHLATEMLSRLMGVKMTHVPYKGMGPAAVDLGAGRIQVGLLAIGSAKAQIASGKVRVLAVAGSRRLVALPNVPTFEEAGVSGYEVTNWFAVMAPKGTPREIVELLNQKINVAQDDTTVAQRMADVGVLPLKESVAQFQKRIVADSSKWRDFIRETGIGAQ